MGFGDDDDKLVVITDGAKRMKLAAFWRDEIPEDAVAVDPENPRLAGEIEANCGLPETTEWIQSEQSVVTAGYGAFVVNNIAADAVVNDKLVGVLSIGPILEQPTGVERFQWNTEKNSWESVWTRGDVSSTSMIPAVSTSSNMLKVLTGIAELPSIALYSGKTIVETELTPSSNTWKMETCSSTLSADLSV